MRVASYFGNRFHFRHLPAPAVLAPQATRAGDSGMVIHLGADLQMRIPRLCG